MEGKSLVVFGANRPRRSRSVRLDSDRSPSSKLDLVPHDSTVFSEAVLLIDPPGGGVRGLRDEIHYGEPSRACRSELGPHETRPCSPILGILMAVEVIKLCAALHTGREPCGRQPRATYPVPGR